MMITPYQPNPWWRIADVPVRQVDPVADATIVGDAPLRDPADQPPLPIRRDDRLEISDDALRLLAAYELNHLARNQP